MERPFELFKYFITFHIDYETKVWPLLSSSIEERSKCLNYIELVINQNVSVEATHREIKIYIICAKTEDCGGHEKVLYDFYILGFLYFGPCRTTS
ncbi:hypothetical protein AB3S75_028681 [Citrus x aurantiifolia]